MDYGVGWVKFEYGVYFDVCDVNVGSFLVRMLYGLFVIWIGIK